jgi:hypothetical protein
MLRFLFIVSFLFMREGTFLRAFAYRMLCEHNRPSDKSGTNLFQGFGLVTAED